MMGKLLRRCSATDLHVLLGQVTANSGLLYWRSDVVAWLLPANVIALPLVVLLDRDVRRSRSSLYMLRLTWLIGIASSCVELFATELSFVSWLSPARIILPMVGSVTLFISLWFHARIVAYVSADPPEIDKTPALDQLAVGWKWVGGWMRQGPVKRFPVPEFEAEAEPKRGRKKATSDEEEEGTTAKRKRRAPAKRTAKSRTRTKPVVEEETEDEQSDSSYGDDAEASSGGYESAAEEVVEFVDPSEELEPKRGSSACSTDLHGIRSCEEPSVK